ncbi:MAG: LemA family protein [Clostridiales bacterium]|uniref:LemA family protein n=1 Tax=Clostridium sp. N3C TaxID=1776758 RepID=UPI0009449464|nr:LemA family protein [Clostridium sp. N3C]NLZ49479.1 LemA family protein [Clostridiales bacterium]
MKKGLKLFLIILAVLVLISMPIISSYNSLVTLEQKVKSAESTIDTQLQRRSDLIPNLVETVKGYASQEKEIFTDISNARSKLAGSQTLEERANADTELSSALSRLLVIVENYPELKSNQNFKDLSVALESTENRISIARQNYNEAVDAYNIKVKRFPGSIVAGIFNFEEKPYYRASEGAEKVPEVNFSK